VWRGRPNKRLQPTARRYYLVRAAGVSQNAWRGTVFDMTTSGFRREVAAALRQAVKAHETGEFAEIGRAYERLSSRLADFPDADSDLRVAIDFLDGWYDSSNHGWQYHDPFGEQDWLRLGLSLASDLEKDAPIDDTVRQLFAFDPRQGLWSRLRAVLKGSA
jgi:hypothetical protein